MASASDATPLAFHVTSTEFDACRLPSQLSFDVSKRTPLTPTMSKIGRLWLTAAITVPSCGAAP
jgi:hypothetical protein